jgi:MoxR-like ATPase
MVILRLRSFHEAFEAFLPQKPHGYCVFTSLTLWYSALNTFKHHRSGMAESSGTTLQLAAKQLSQIIVGKPEQITLALTCLVAGGHLLIEDRPGVGKTTLALALARVMGLDFKRVQFTSDLLPSDILGSAVYSRETERFHFRAGPIFTNVLLADEINRASSKTQSALLEAMEEHAVSIEGTRTALPEPLRCPNRSLTAF